jgi:hypothetical protein
VQRGEERRLGALLVDRAAPHDHLAELGQVDDLRLPRRRAPLLGLDLLDVVHEVQADRARRAGVERREHARVAVGRDALDLAEAGVAQHPHQEVAALGDAAVLGGDRRLANPLLQASDALGVALRDLVVDRLGGDGRTRATR